MTNRGSFVTTYVKDFERVAGRVEDGEQHDREKDQDKRLHVEEYQREEQVVGAVFN